MIFSSDALIGFLFTVFKSINVKYLKKCNFDKSYIATSISRFLGSLYCSVVLELGQNINFKKSRKISERNLTFEKLCKISYFYN